MARKKFLVNLDGYFATKLVSATVETAAPTEVVLTFASGSKIFSNAVAGEFSLVGKTISGIVLDQAAGTLTITVTVGYAAGADFTLTYNPTQKGDTVTTTIINNVA